VLFDKITLSVKQQQSIDVETP